MEAGENTRALPPAEPVAGREWLAVLAIGIAAGVAGALIADLEGPWIGFLMAAVLAGLVLVAVRDPIRLVGGVFVLSLQADAAYRILYGRAGSEGMAFPLVVLVGAAWTLLWWFSGRDRNRPIEWGGPLLVPIALMFVAALVACVFSSERFIGATAILFQLELYFVFWLAIQMVHSRADLSRMVHLLLACLATQCVVYFVQSALGVGFTLEGDRIGQGVVPRPGGTVSTNPAGFASFVIPIAMVAMARFLLTLRREERYWLGLLVAMAVLAVGLTFTRVAWAGLAFASLHLVATSWRRGWLPTGRVLWIGAALAVMVTAFVPTMLVRTEDAPIDEAYAERAGLMHIALEIIGEHPVTGVGPGAYAYVYKRHLPENFGDQWLYKVHNEYLLRTAETGLLGGVAWIAILVCGFRLARRLTRVPIYEVQTLGLGWSAGLLAVAWQMYWVPWDGFQYNALLWFFLGLTVAALRMDRGAGQLDSVGDARPTDAGLLSRTFAGEG